MTDARATQAAGLCLIGGAAGAVATQASALALIGGAAGAVATMAAALVLAPEPAPVRATLSAALAITGVEAGTRVTLAAALVLCDAVPCLTFWAQCWRIARTDGTVMGFTSHDRPVVFQGTVYQPCHSLSASASELAAVLGSVGNLELAGIIADEAISEADLAGGLYDGAFVEVWLVPWPDHAELP